MGIQLQWSWWMVLLFVFMGMVVVPVIYIPVAIVQGGGPGSAFIVAAVLFTVLTGAYGVLRGSVCS